MKILNATSLTTKPVAVLYQATASPSLGGSVKPANPLGYRDSSADIAFAMDRAGCHVVTPTRSPRPGVDADWSFPDSNEGISAAVSKGAEIVWANTSLFCEHPIANFGYNDLRIIGQPIRTVERFEDKHVCHAAITQLGIPVPEQALVSLGDQPAQAKDLVGNALSASGLKFPIIVKPCRGRGSAGVRLLNSPSEAAEHIELLSGPKFGKKFLLEEYLPGGEWAVTVMPPGVYEMTDGLYIEANPWALPPIRRTGHQDGVMPFSGVVPPLLNSTRVESDNGIREFEVMCVRIAQFLGATAPIRIDCRADANNVTKAIDINMKPSMTGPGRPGREEMINLSGIAANAVGWSYTELLVAIAANAAPIRHIIGQLEPAESEV